LIWANWAINQRFQFARHELRKPIVRQVLEMVAGVRNLPIAPTIRFEIPIVEVAA